MVIEHQFINGKSFVIRDFILIIYRNKTHSGFGPQRIRIADQAMLDEFDNRNLPVAERLMFVVSSKIFCFLERDNLMLPASEVDLKGQGIDHYSLMDPINPKTDTLKKTD